MSWMGLLATVIYLISLTFFMFAFYNLKFLPIGLIIGTLFLVIGTIILGWQVKKEIERGISWKFW